MGVFYTSFHPSDGDIHLVNTWVLGFTDQHRAPGVSQFGPNYVQKKITKVYKIESNVSPILLK